MLWLRNMALRDGGHPLAGEQPGHDLPLSGGEVGQLGQRVPVGSAAMWGARPSAWISLLILRETCLRARRPAIRAERLDPCPTPASV